MTSLIKILVATLVSLLLFSCNFDGVFNQLDGKGEITTQQHELESFNQIIVENGWNASLIQSENPRLVVSANENLHPVLQFSVKNGQLHIRAKKSIGLADAKNIQVYFPDKLHKISVSSGSEIVSGETFKQEKIKVNASSGGEIKLAIETNFAEVESSSGAEIALTGTSKNITTKASSGSEIEAKNLQTEVGNAKASSGSEITLTTLKKIVAEASSGGEVNYFGNPESVSVNADISGEIRKR